MTGDYLREWLASVEPTVRGRTFDSSSGIVRAHLLPRLARVPLSRQPTAWSVEDEMLVGQAIAAVGMAVEFATERAGATGDAYLSISIVTVGAPAEVELIHIRQGPPMQFSGSHRVSGVERSTVLISLDDAPTAQGRLVIARLALMGIFQWFGYPEVPQITDAGKLRRPYFGHQNRPGVESWAARNAVETVDTTVEVEP